jgi:predicted dehydrogenase
MLDKEANNIDAVIIAIPDHMHAIAAMQCMERGKHVYVQKPLCRTIWEARQLKEAAVKYKVATQMGNQGYSNEGTRQCAEIIWHGDIGNVTEVHAWTDRPMWPQGLNEIPKEDPVPETLDWDSWLGIGDSRPFTVGGSGYPTQYGNFYQPFNWRGFYDFGCGAIGDMACHILGAANLALQLGTPSSVECLKKEGASTFMFPKSSILRYEFPARGSMPPVKLTWYDGLKENPKIPGVPEGEVIGDLGRVVRPGQDQAQGPGQGRGPGQAAGRGGPGQVPGRGGPGQGFGGPFGQRDSAIIGPVFRYEEGATYQPARVPDGSLFIGDKGMLTTGTYGENTRLIPVAKMKDYRMPPALLTRSPGHYQDWIRACKGGDPACSNFNIAAPFVEWMLLGVIALRVEGKIEYEPAKMKITNNSEANKYLKPNFRKGWSFS